ncbi:MAG: hypothetical protein Q9217_000362 [Psora testacea]
MNPFHYLHLEQPEVDIRGSQVALYARFNPKKKSSHVLAISLLDGRWKKIVEQPQSRIDESLSTLNPRSRNVLENPFFVFIIYLTTALEWWINALHSFDEQLIAHEKRLQKELDTNDKSSSTVYGDMNRALHAMSAHLHRYGSELSSTEDTISDLIIRHGKVFGTVTDAASSVAQIEVSLAEAKGQVRAAETIRLELEQKTQNILALLFNRIQLSTDKVMIDNGQSMQGIMVASQAEATSSRMIANAQQRLTEDMKEDSVAMKTIAVLTMFFLPGTSFAAILATPFFATNSWMTHAARFWLWFVLTVPSTGLAILYYKYWRNSRDPGHKEKENPQSNSHDLEMNPVNGNAVTSDDTVNGNAR